MTAASSQKILRVASSQKILRVASQTYSVGATNARRQRLINGARRYAIADRSDPFTLDRCLSEISLGMLDEVQHMNSKKEICYDASPVTITRQLPSGHFSDGKNEYLATEYRNMIRP